MNTGYMSFEDSWVLWLDSYLHTSYRAMGARFTAAFNPVPFNKLIPSARTAPFGEAGATGIPATTLSVPLVDQAAMALDHKATLSQYRNPFRGA